MLVPEELKYQKTDEWVKVEDGIATIGITDYAQDSLSDVVFVEFAIDPDDEVSAGDSLATIESVKAAAEVVFPVSEKSSKSIKSSPTLPSCSTPNPTLAVGLPKSRSVTSLNSTT